MMTPIAHLIVVAGLLAAPILAGASPNRSPAVAYSLAQPPSAAASPVQGTQDAGRANAPGESPQDSTNRALLRLVYDPTTGLDSEAILVILANTGAVRRELESALGRKITAPGKDEPELQPGGLVFTYWFERADQPVEIKLSPHVFAADAGRESTWRSMLIEVRVRTSEANSEIKWRAVLQGVRNGVLAVLQESSKAQREQLQASHSESRERLDTARRELQDIQQRMGALQFTSGRPVLSRQALLEELHEMQTQVRSLEIELAAKHARRQRLEERIARVTKEAASDPNAQIIERELTHILELRKEQLARLRAMSEAAAASVADVRECETAVAEAQVRLAQHRRETQRAAGGEALSALNIELTHLAAEAAEFEVRLAMLRKFIEELKGEPLKLAHEYERLATAELPTAQHALELAQRRSAEAEERLARLRAPDVTVIGGATD